jgi:hypothetical protein
MGSSGPHIQRIPGPVFLGGLRVAERGTDYLFTSSAEVTTYFNYTNTTPTQLSGLYGDKY